MNTHPLINLEVSLDELVSAFQKLPDNAGGELDHHKISFAVTNDYGNTTVRNLLFTWNKQKNDWELDTKGHDLLITASKR